MAQSQLRDASLLAGRILMASIFIMSGPGKVAHPVATAAYMASAGFPAVSALALLVGVFELTAGLALALGFRTRASAGALSAFTLLATISFHQFWAADADHYLTEQLMFMKNIGLIGGLLVIAAIGGGRWGIEQLFGRGALPARSTG
jgi:putative oxidoreductase